MRKANIVNWKFGFAWLTCSIGDFLACSMNCSGNCVVRSKAPLSMPARRLESSGMILMTIFSNFTGPGFLYIDGPHL